eukprot:SAG31_NODE_1148_length_9661_cov_24.669839_7_plen_138_part_00
MHWAAYTKSLEAHQRAADWGLQTPFQMSRQTPTGAVLKWSLSVPAGGAPLPEGGVLPFLIDWEDVVAAGNHPAKTSPQGCKLVELRLAHPSPDAITSALAKIGLKGVAVEYIVAESKIGNYDYSLLRANMRARYITR